jgi:hypothetical protein
MSYQIHWESLRRAFAGRRKPPALLSAFAEHLRSAPEQYLGDFELVGHYLSESVLPGANDIAEHFTLFIGFGNGDSLGFWFSPAHSEATDTPIVLIAHDDAASVVAPNLGLFLALLGSESPVQAMPGDFWPEVDAAQAAGVLSRAHFRRWLLTLQLQAKDALEGAEQAQQAQLQTQLDAFFDQHRQRHEATLHANDSLKALGQELAQYRMRWRDARSKMQDLDLVALDAAAQAMRVWLTPEDQKNLPKIDEAWRDSWFQSMAGMKIPEVQLLRIQAAGEIVEVDRLDQGDWLPVPEEHAAAALIIQLRQEEAAQHPERGVWFVATLTIDENCVPCMSRESRALPSFQRSAKQAVDAALQNDMVRFPRTLFWSCEPPA